MMINLRILVPDSTTNYAKNPSFELDTTGWGISGEYTETFSDNFTRANGLIGNGWDTTNSAWTISGNTAIATPPLGAELFVNGVFGVDANWTKGTGWTIAAGVASKAAGTASALTQTIAAVLHRWLKVTYALTRAAGGLSTLIGNKLSVTNSASKTVISLNRVASVLEAGMSANATFVGTVDNASAKLTVTSDLFATRAGFSANASIAANAIVTSDVMAGVSGWVDSYTNPQNFVILYINGANGWFLEKCVAGSYAFINGGSATYAAGAEIKMVGVRSGANLLVTPYYNGVALAAASTISDVAIVSNTRHGLFSTSELNSFSAVTISSSTASTNTDFTRSLDRARFGTASGKVVTYGALLNEGVYYKVSWLNGVNDVLTASIYARGGGKIRIRLADATTGSNFISKSVSLNDERWTRLEVTGRCSGGNDVRLWVESDNPVAMAQTFYIDGAQIERKSAATSYCDGDQDGCRWNVVANATISTRTADTREGGRWVPLAGPCRPNNDLYVTTLGGFGMPPIVNNIQSWANAPGSFFQNEKIQNRVVTFSFHVKKESFRTGGSAPSILALHELRQQLINLFKSDVTLNSQAFLFEYSDSETDKKLYIRMRYEAGLEGEWDIRNRWFNSFPVRMIAVDPLWSEDSQDVMPLVIKDTYSGVLSQEWVRIDGQWQRITESSGASTGALYVGAIVEGNDGAIYISEIITPFTLAGRMVKWDGSSLTNIGTFDAGVFALAVAPDGTIYAGGGFTTIGGVAAARIAKYTPSTGVWSVLGSGLNGDCYSVCVAPNGQVYVCGQFTTAGGVSCLRVARWDGVQWRTVGATSGVNGTITYSLINAGDGKTIYMGGDFTASNGGSVTYNRVASIDTETNLISQMGYGIGDNNVLAMAVGLDGTVYAGGNFLTSAAPSADPLLHIAKWSGGQIWEPLGDGLEKQSGSASQVSELAIGLNGEIFAGGTFDASGEKELTVLSKWFGGNWLPLEFPSAILTRNASINEILQTENGNLYVGGFFDETNYEFPKTNTITNNGTASCWPILTVTGAGTLHYISNVKTEQEIFLNLDVFSGETVTIDFARGKIESDTRGDLTYTLLSGSEIRSIYLLPGENTISVLMNNDVGASMQLRWEPLDWSADSIVEAESL